MVGGRRPGSHRIGGSPQPHAHACASRLSIRAGAVIVGATVTVTGAERDDARCHDRAGADDRNWHSRSSPAWRPGRYAVEAEFTGFEKRTLPDVRVRSGDNRQSAMLDDRARRGRR